MKKMIAVLLALTLVFTLAACSSSAPDPGSSDASQPSSSTANNSSTESTAPCIICHNRELQNHLVYLSLAVAAHGNDLIFVLI